MADANKQQRRSRHVYVIDHDYRVVYLDSNARRIFPNGRIGALCYESFRNSHKPCIDCPWQPDDPSGVNQTVIYSQHFDQWYEITCLELDWFNQGPCILFAGCPASDTDHHLFSTLTSPSSYDELFEINVTDDSYRVLFSEPNKYVMPAPEGCLSEMFFDVLEHMIHPDDRERFATFWNLETIIDRVTHAQAPLQAQFRKRLCAGGWGWASQTIVPVKRGDRGEMVIMCFISDVDQQAKAYAKLNEDTELRELKERDQLTGLYNAATFYTKAEHLIQNHPDTAYEAAYLDIEHFKLYNEWYGRQAGDVVLQTIAQHITDLMETHDGVAGYLGGDDFVMVLPAGIVTEKNLEKRMQHIASASEDLIGFQPIIGVCPIKQGPDAVVVACDHAMVAMNSAKGRYDIRVARYRPIMTKELETETKILQEVKRGLKEHEFVLYWQPQCNTRTGRIVGLEALVRWQHPERGLIMPGQFVPVLERNGFIANLDLYVWEEVCRQLRTWIDEGKEPLPTSVNISRADLYAIDVAETVEELTTRYGIDRKYLQLEVTESSYAEDQKVSETVNQLKEHGYTVFMDDFGSGYSSLNMLKNINVDVIKIDMDFLNRERNIQRGENIFEAIISMARLMNLRIIAEGAETSEQVKFLQDANCNYAQGFFFYRPMDTESLERLIANEEVVDRRGVLTPMVETIDMDALVRKDETSRTIIDNLIGGMAVYAVQDGKIQLLQVNNEYYRVTGCNPVDLRERQKYIWKQVHPDDLDTALALFAKAEQHPVSGAEGIVRRYRLNGDLMWMRMRVFFLKQQGSRSLFYAAVEDVTGQQQTTC